MSGHLKDGKSNKPKSAQPCEADRPPRTPRSGHSALKLLDALLSTREIILACPDDYEGPKQPPQKRTGWSHKSSKQKHTARASKLDMCHHLSRWRKEAGGAARWQGIRTVAAMGAHFASSARRRCSFARKTPGTVSAALPRMNQTLTESSAVHPRMKPMVEESVFCIIQFAKAPVAAAPG